MTQRHWFLLLLTAALFGSSFFFIKIAVADVPPLTIAAGRALVAALAIGVVAGAMGARLPAPGARWRLILIVGFLTAIVPYALIALGQTRIDSALGGILFAAIPLFTLALSRVFLPDQDLTPGRIIGALVGLGGVAVVMGPQALLGLGDQLTGAGVTLVAAASYAAGGIVARTRADIPPLVMAMGQVTVAAPVLVALSLLADAPWRLDLPPTALGAVVATGLVSTALPVLLFFKLVREIGPARTSVLTFFMPVFAVLLGTLLLGETLDPAAYLGFGLITLGAVLVSRQPAAPQKPAVSES